MYLYHTIVTFFFCDITYWTNRAVWGNTVVDTVKGNMCASISTSVLVNCTLVESGEVIGATVELGDSGLTPAHYVAKLATSGARSFCYKGH